jgi:hypothetical protein
MTSTPSPRPVSALRARMIEDMTVRGFTEETRSLSAVAGHRDTDYWRMSRRALAFEVRRVEPLGETDSSRVDLRKTRRVAILDRHAAEVQGHFARAVKRIRSTAHPNTPASFGLRPPSGWTALWL